MKRYKQFMLGMLAGTALTFVALRYHVVRHTEGVSLVPRNPQPPLRSIYSDVREWGSAMWEQHPEVAQALIANDQIDVISDEALNDVSLQVDEMYRQSNEKLQELLSDYRSDRARATIAEVETTSVSIEESGNNSGVTIGRFPQGAFHNPSASEQVPIVEEVTPPASSNQPPAPFRNPFDFQPRRSESPTVGAGSSIPSSAEAVAERSRDPWLRESSHVSQASQVEVEELISSIPASREIDLGDSSEIESIDGWLPGLLSNLIATDGETMHGQAQPTTHDIGIGIASPQSTDQQLIQEPEALREPIIQVRPF